MLLGAGRELQISYCIAESWSKLINSIGGQMEVWEAEKAQAFSGSSLKRLCLKLLSYF